MYKTLAAMFTLATLFTPTIWATTDCQSQRCQDLHHFAIGKNAYPYFERISHEGDPATPSGIPEDVAIPVDNTWTRVQSGCELDGNAGLNLLDVTTNFNALMRMFFQFRTGAAAGMQYEVEFRVDDLAYGHAIRRYNGASPQAEHFMAVATNLPSGSHRMEFWARTITPNAVLFAEWRYITATGSPAATVTSIDTQPVTLTDPVDIRQDPEHPEQHGQEIIGPIAFTVPPGANVDLFPQAYLEFNAGTTQDHIQVGFQLDSAPLQRNSMIYGPSFYPDGINVVDYFKCVPPGNHTLSFWVENTSGNTSTIGVRRLEYVAFVSSSAEDLGEKSDYTSQTIVQTPTGVDPDPNDQPTPESLLLPKSATAPWWRQTPPYQEGDGWWKRLLTFDVNPGAPTAPVTWFGVGYLEILSRTGAWTDPLIDGGNPVAQIGIEVKQTADSASNCRDDNPQSCVCWPTGICATDFHTVAVTVPATGSTQVYFFLDAGTWGAGQKNTVTLWARKWRLGGAPASFTVGKRYMALRRVTSQGEYGPRLFGILEQPVAPTGVVPRGQPLNLSVKAAPEDGSGGSWTYTWFYEPTGSQPIMLSSGSSPSQTSTIPAYMPRDSGEAYVTVTNDCGTVESTHVGIPLSVRRHAARFAIDTSSTAAGGAPTSLTVTALSGSDAVITDYIEDVAFASSDNYALLPSRYTFTYADHGIHTFQLTYNTSGNQTLTTTEHNESGVGVFATSSTTVSTTVVGAPAWCNAYFDGAKVTVTWPAVTNATSYNVYRYSVVGHWTSTPLVSGATSVSIDDTPPTALAQPGTAAAAYVYSVTARIGSAESNHSPEDYAATFVYRLDNARPPKILGTDFGDLRYAADAIRIAAGLPPVFASYSALSGYVAASDVLTIRAALDAAREQFHYPAVTYSYPATSMTLAHLQDVTEMEDAVH